MLKQGRSGAPLNINWGQMIYDQMMGLVTSQGTTLVHYALIELAIILVCKIAIMASAQSLRHALGGRGGWHTSYHFEDYLILLFQAALITWALNHYMTVIEWPLTITRDIVMKFDQTTIDQFMGFINDTITKLKKPNPLQILDIWIYVMVLLDMGILVAAMFVITSFSFAMYGAWVVVGPVILPLAITKYFSKVFWAWVSRLMSLAAYRIFAAAIALVWSGMFTQFFIQGVGPDFSLVNWLFLLPVVMLLSVGFVYCSLQIPKEVNGVLGVAGYAGQEFTNAIGAGLKAVAAVI